MASSGDKKNKKKQLCKFSTSDCRFGDQCKFAHIKTEKVAPAQRPTSNAQKKADMQANDASKLKRKLDYTASWVAMIETMFEKKNVGALQLYLDALRTGESKKVPNFMPPEAGELGLQSFQGSRTLNVQQVIDIAKKEGYEAVQYNRASRVLGFERGDVNWKSWEKVNVYFSTGTVGTCLYHPRYGWSQMFRRGSRGEGVNLTELQAIFDNPRTHLGQGYRKKKDMPDLKQSGDSDANSTNSTVSNLSGSSVFSTDTMFSALDIDEDEDEDSIPSFFTQPDEAASLLIMQCGNDHAMAAFSSSPHQLRYLEVRLICCMTELLRERANDAPLAIKPQLWTDAYEAINTILPSVKDDWAPAIVQYKTDQEFNQSGAMTNSNYGEHSIELALHYWNSFHTLLDDTENHKNLAVRQAEIKLKRVLAKLTPLLEGRDEARASMGDVAWKENKTPKNDRNTTLLVSLQREKKDISQCLDVLNNLGFV